MDLTTLIDALTPTEREELLAALLDAEGSADETGDETAEGGGCCGGRSRMRRREMMQRRRMCCGAH